MGRPIYSYELGDPDFSWLINNFQETFPGYAVIENSCLPIVFIEKIVSLSQQSEEGDGEFLRDDEPPVLEEDEV